MVIAIVCLKSVSTDWMLFQPTWARSVYIGSDQGEEDDARLSRSSYEKVRDGMATDRLGNCI